MGILDPLTTPGDAWVYGPADARLPVPATNATLGQTATWDPAQPTKLAYGWPGHDLRDASLKPNALTIETFARGEGTLMTNTAYPTVSGTMYLVAIALPSQFVVTTISFLVGATALVLGTSPHAWFALYTSGAVLVAQSADDTAPSMPANTLKTYSLSAPQTVAASDLFYITFNITMTGGTLPSLIGETTDTVSVGLTRKLHGTGTTGLTGAAPGSSAIAVAGFKPYGGVA